MHDQAKCNVVQEYKFHFSYRLWKVLGASSLSDCDKQSALSDKLLLCRLSIGALSLDHYYFAFTLAREVVNSHLAKVCRPTQLHDMKPIY